MNPPQVYMVAFEEKVGGGGGGGEVAFFL